MCPRLWGGEKLFRYGDLGSHSGEILVFEDPLEIEVETLTECFTASQHYVVYMITCVSTHHVCQDRPCLL